MTTLCQEVFERITFWIILCSYRKPIVFMVSGPGGRSHDTPQKLFSILETPRYFKESKKPNTFYSTILFVGNLKSYTLEKLWTCVFQSFWKFRMQHFTISKCWHFEIMQPRNFDFRWLQLRESHYPSTYRLPPCTSPPLGGPEGTWFLGHLHFLFFFQREIEEIEPFQAILRALAPCRGFFCIKSHCNQPRLNTIRAAALLKNDALETNMWPQSVGWGS